MQGTERIMGLLQLVAASTAAAERTALEARLAAREAHHAQRLQDALAAREAHHAQQHHALVAALQAAEARIRALEAELQQAWLGTPHAGA
jgi:hypothetical protein